MHTDLTRAKGFLQTGLSLIEMTVALALSAIILLSMGQIFQTSRAQIQTQESTSRIQENARQALQFMSDDVRMAGFMGAVYQYWLVEESQHPQSSLPQVTNECFSTATQPFRWSVPFVPVGGNPDLIPPRLYGQNDSFSWFTGCITNPINFFNNPASDVLSMHYAGAPWISAAGAVQTSAIPDPTIGDSDEMFYIRGMTSGAVVFTCGKGSGAGAVGAGGGGSCINRSVGGSAISNATLQTALQSGAAETSNYGLQSVLYYVRPCTTLSSGGVCSTGGDNTPALVRARMEYNTANCPIVMVSPGGGGGGASSGGAGGASSGGGSSRRPCVIHEVVAEGVVSMQLEYGLDTTPSDGNDNVTQYLRADQISATLNSAADYAAWSNVRTVRVWLLVRSTLREPGYVSANTNGTGGNLGKFDVAGAIVTPQNGYRYQLFTSTLKTRNRWRSF